MGRDTWTSFAKLRGENAQNPDGGSHDLACAIVGEIQSAVLHQSHNKLDAPCDLRTLTPKSYLLSRTEAMNPILLARFAMSLASALAKARFCICICPFLSRLASWSQAPLFQDVPVASVLEPLGCISAFNADDER